MQIHSVVLRLTSRWFGCFSRWPNRTMHIIINKGILKGRRPRGERDLNGQVITRDLDKQGIYPT